MNQAESNNHFLQLLEVASSTRLQHHLKRRHLKMSQVLFGNSGIDRIVFPLDAIVSLDFCLDHACGELSTVGHEGFLGISMVAQTKIMLGQCVVRQAGDALEMDLDTFAELLQHYPSIKRLCDRYVLYRMLTMAQRAACQHMHTVMQRVCQKLLVWDDRNGGQRHFAMTHQNLADMVGIQRSTASSHASRLQSLGLINYIHGKVVIRNHDQLSCKSCQCYTIANTLYERLIDSDVE